LKQSKRATSRIIVGNEVTIFIELSIAGDIAILDRGWTSVVAREHIVVEKQNICETEK
jgi:hypothetical protein